MKFIKYTWYALIALLGACEATMGQTPKIYPDSTLATNTVSLPNGLQWRYKMVNGKLTYYVYNSANGRYSLLYTGQQINQLFPLGLAGQSIRVNSAGTAFEAYTPTNGGGGAGTLTQLTATNTNGFTFNITSPTYAPNIILSSDTVNYFEGKASSNLRYNYLRNALTNKYVPYTLATDNIQLGNYGIFAGYSAFNTNLPDYGLEMTNNNENGFGFDISAGNATNEALRIRNFNNTINAFSVLGNGNTTIGGTLTAQAPTYATGGYNLVVRNNTTGRYESVTGGSVGSGTVTSITPGTGFTSTTPITTTGTLNVDSTQFRTVANSFTKAQTNSQIATAVAAIPTYTASSGVNKTGNNFSSDTTYNRTVANSLSLSQLQTKLNTYTLQTRNIAAGTGLTGGGNLTADRTIGADTTVLRTTANSLTLAQLQTRLNGYVPTTRTLTNGVGIQTIGDLSANRTISADTAGTLASKTYLQGYTYTKGQTNTLIGNTTTAINLKQSKILQNYVTPTGGLVLPADSVGGAILKLDNGKFNKPTGTIDQTLDGTGTPISNFNYTLLNKSYPTTTTTTLQNAAPIQSTKFTYNATTSTYTATAAIAYAVINGSLAATSDGYIQATYAAANNVTAVLGLDLNNTLNNYSTPWQYQLYVYPPNLYYYAENSGAGVSTGITAAVGDIYRIRRDGTTGIVYGERSQNSGTTWSIVRTFTTTNTGVLYYKVAQVSSGNIANTVRAMLPTTALFQNGDVPVYNPNISSFSNVGLLGSSESVNMMLPGFGGSGDGVSDNYAAYNSAVAASGPRHRIFFPQNSTNNAVYYFATAPSFTGVTISADAGVVLSIPSSNSTTFSGATFTTTVSITSRDRSNTGLMQPNNVPDFVFKGRDYISEKTGIQIPVVVDATTFGKRQYNTTAAGFTAGVSTLTASNQVTWATSSITSATAIDVVGNTPIVGKEYLASFRDVTIASTGRVGVVVDFGIGYTFFSIDPANKWYIGTYTSAYTESTGITLPTSAYSLSNTGNSTYLTYRMVSANTVEFYVNGVYITTYTASNTITFAGSGYYGSGSTSGGAANSYDFVLGTSVNRPISRDLLIDVYGDSITFGEGSSLTWPNLLKQLLEGTKGIGKATIANYAVSGQTAAQQYAILNTNGAVGKDAVLVMVGTNDIQAQTAIATFKTNIANIIIKIKAGGAIPIIAIPPTFISSTLTGSGYATTNFDRGGIYRSAVIRVAAEQGGCIIADVNSAIGAVSATEQQYRDNIHPQSAYMATIATEFAKATIQALSPKNVYDTFIDNNLVPTGVAHNYRAIMASTTLLTTDYTLNATSGTFSQALPLTPTTGQIYIIKNSGTGVVTVTSTSIDGQTSQPIPSGGSIQVQYTGTSGIYIIL